jgi:hypothetical protein
MPKPKKTAAPPTDQDGCLILQGELFWKWKAADSEIRYVAEALKVNQTEIEVLLDKYPDVKAVFGTKTSLIQRSLSSQTEMRHVQAELEKYLGMSMKNVSIDDQTGRVFLHHPEGEPVPVKPKAAKSVKSKKKQ